MPPAGRSRPNASRPSPGGLVFLLHVPGVKLAGQRCQVCRRLARLLGLLKLVCGAQPQVGRVGLVFGGPGPGKKRSRSFPVIALARHCPHHVLRLCARRQNPRMAYWFPCATTDDTPAGFGFEHGLERFNGPCRRACGRTGAAARLPPAGKPLAVVRHGLRALELQGQPQPLACETGEGCARAQGSRPSWRAPHIAPRAHDILSGPRAWRSSRVPSPQEITLWRKKASLVALLVRRPTCVHTGGRPP